MSEKVAIFDSSLRDGAQAEGISFSVEDKLKLLELLDGHGIDYIEAGNPGSNPKDLEFFARAKTIQLKHARLAAFGSTRRRDIKVEQDSNVHSLLLADTPVVVIFGKSWDFHVTDIIRTTLEENLAMIRETLAFFKAKGKEVVYDAEHFFDGYRANPEYALRTLRDAAEAGAGVVILCDTNGGTMPERVAEVVAEVKRNVPCEVGIHCHNDCELAVANAIAAIRAGASQVQGTINGYGERVGNADLSAIIPDLQLKMGLEVMSPEQLRGLTRLSRYVAEVANLKHDDHAPYVGESAFAHKGGIHVAAVLKRVESYQHVDPALVGNEPRAVVSELSGRG